MLLLFLLVAIINFISILSANLASKNKAGELNQSDERTLHKQLSASQTPGLTSPKLPDLASDELNIGEVHI